MQASVPTEAGSIPGPKPLPPTKEVLAAAFPQLEILELAGQGGMGFVYKARQPKLDRLVALKILPESLATDPAFAERFNREGRVLARLNHPNIVIVHDFGMAGGFFYLLMEFVDGVNLRQAMKAGRFTPTQALAVVPKICEALQFAHNEGILHRDIKPENILLDAKGRVKIADFGIAKLLGTGAPAGERGGDSAHGVTCPTVAGLTETGKVIGTPNYMAPEQLEHPQDVDQRADIYSLGVVFYEMLTGELPVGRFAPPSQKAGIDPRLDEVVLHTLEKERERRTASAEEVRAQVETIAGKAAASRQNVFSRIRARKGVWLAVAAGLFLLIAAAVLLIPNFVPVPSRDGATQGPREVICETIRTEVGRQLREAGASYDDLEVTVATNVNSATPFKVRYRGLQNLKAPDGTNPNPDGQFIMQYIGAGQWQGELAGNEFTVLVGSRDNIDLPFVDDPQAVGRWESVDFVPSPADFSPASDAGRARLFLKGYDFLEGGKTPQPWFTWTKGVVMHHGDRTASHYEIRELKGDLYMFVEWKSGDVTISGMKPSYYVLRKKR